MIFRYTELPDSTGSKPRPIVDLGIESMETVLVPCLIDSGALNSLLPAWSADIAGVDLTGIAEEPLGAGGSTTTARFVTVSLSAADLVWEAEVGFCDPWPYAWGLLGHDSFFRWFTVTFRAADYEFELAAITA
jgi:hypothetical protein